MILCIIVEQKKCFDTVDAWYKHEESHYSWEACSGPWEQPGFLKSYYLF
jgi:hypothetical protein